jgi:diguanylate cyclase (GGDEF)-like protein
MVVAIVIAVSSTAYVSLRRTDAQAAHNLEVRGALSASIHGVRAELVEAYKSLDLFLLEPTVTTHQHRFYAALQSAAAHADTLRASEWVAEHRQEQTASMIVERVDQLRREIAELVATRLDSARQYPSLAVGNQLMQPNRDRAENALSVIFNEIAMEGTQVKHATAYGTFLRAQRLWMQMLSNFRLYLANRVGSFNESALAIQEQGIVTLYEALMQTFGELEQLDARGEVGFESSSALADLRRAVTAWYRGFEQAREIHRTDRWRMDSVLMKQNIAPSVDVINRQLLVIENAISGATSRDIDQITAAAAALAWTLWLVAGLSIVFVVLVVATTDRLVLRPIAVVTRALKAEALGKTGVEMPASRALETRDLIDAFGEMHRQVRQRQSELEYRALHDALTTLPNRTLLLERIDHGIQLARRHGEHLCLLMLDLDRFKEVNDTLGHHVGDRLLIEVGDRLRACLRETDTVARLGGDEFAILLPNTDATTALQAVEKLLETFRHPVTLEGIELKIAASIGVAVYPDHGDQPQGLMQHADVAMYLAKRNQSGFELYDSGKDEYTLTRLAMITDLRQAVERDTDQLQLHYQPIVMLATGKVISVEALLRWQHPVHGGVAPQLVIEMAEQTGLIGPLTYSVFDKALAQAARWRAGGISLNLSINLSMHNLRDAHLAARLGEALARHGVPGDSVTAEVTESAMMANPRQVMAALRALDVLGMRLAVDDFGTGFSSLAYLKALPVDVLKIDKSFVIDLQRDKSDRAIVQATLSLGHDLGLEVIAEGVEDRETWDLLRDMGCDAAQGFHMSPALPADRLERWLADQQAADRSSQQAT